jgi:signal peptidase I
VVRDDSMLPTIRPGDRLLVDSSAYRGRPPSVGDVVVIVDPEERTRWLIKRVAGVGPGRFWRTRTGQLTPVRAASGNELPPPNVVDTVVLAESTVYVTGDGPGARDSRGFGPVRLAAIVGRAYCCYAPPARRCEL